MNAVRFWKDAFSKRSFRNQFFLSLLALFVILKAFARFLLWNEQRPGAILSDPVLSLYSSIDLSGYIFAAIYTMLFFTLIQLSSRPFKILVFCQCYAAIVALRMLLMWLVPLEPPQGMIPLVDPLALYFLDATKTLNKDLFFSGHTALSTLCFWMVGRGWKRLFVTAVGTSVVFGVLIQKDHYVIDVLAAAMVATMVYFTFSYLHSAEIKNES